MALTQSHSKAKIMAKALQAIQKVEENLEPKQESKTDKKNAETVPSQAQKLTSFLEAHMLGIITYLSDIIQDVQGRKSNDMKQDVLRGLGQLIVHVGSSINIIGPQVSQSSFVIRGTPQPTSDYGYIAFLSSTF